jgi:EAL domain-containing protein (putative c-di-GMP-specific phosphodiesterase class I)/GGDEF domain-containing protein
MTGSPPANPIEKTRRDRDRFLALALAGADALFETDEKGRIIFAVGRVMNLLGRGARSIEGETLLSLVAAEDVARFQQVTDLMRKGNRVADITVKLADGKAEARCVRISGHRLGTMNDHLFLAMNPAPPPAPPAQQPPDPQTGLLDRNGFTAAAKSRLDEAARSGLSYEMTLLDLPNIEALRKKVGNEATEQFVAHLGDYLKSLSVGGDSAGRLDATKYGVVHTDAIKPDAIRKRVSEMAKEAAPKAPPVAVHAASLELDVGDVSPEEAAQALAYTINQFSRQEGESFSLTSLSKGLKIALSSTVSDMNKLKQMVSKGDFDIVFQPVVGLKDYSVHHFECLARIRTPGKDGESPFRLVTFAEDTGLIAKLDFAIFERCASLLKKNIVGDRSIGVAVNVSGRSLSDPAYVQDLRLALKKYPGFGKRLLFEMTESAEVKDLNAVNAVLQELRREGHPVCLDDFGAGAAAFHYLRALTVDFVKIDGSYVRNVLSNRLDVPFLKAITSLCRDLKIKVIAEMIEDAGTVDLLRSLGVQFGQGYYFGRPSAKPPNGATAESDEAKGAAAPQNFVRREGVLYWSGP